MTDTRTMEEQMKTQNEFANWEMVDREEVQAEALRALDKVRQPRMRIALLAVRRTLAGAQTKAFLGSLPDSR